MKNVVANIVCGLGVLLAVMGSASLAQAETAILTWSNSDTQDQVQVDRAVAPGIAQPTTGPFTKLSTVLAAGLTYTDTTIPAGTSVCYRVENINSAGVGPASNVSCKTFFAVPTVAPVLDPIP